MTTKIVKTPQLEGMSCKDCVYEKQKEGCAVLTGDHPCMSGNPIRFFIYKEVEVEENER